MRLIIDTRRNHLEATVHHSNLEEALAYELWYVLARTVEFLVLIPIPRFRKTEMHLKAKLS